MAIKNVKVDKDKCAASTLCETICPEVFEVNDYAKVKEGVDFDEYEDDIKDAELNCPTQAIIVEEE